MKGVGEGVLLWAGKGLRLVLLGRVREGLGWCFSGGLVGLLVEFGNGLGGCVSGGWVV